MPNRVAYLALFLCDRRAAKKHKEIDQKKQEQLTSYENLCIRNLIWMTEI
jgi:hypothetical protein